MVQKFEETAEGAELNKFGLIEPLKRLMRSYIRLIYVPKINSKYFDVFLALLYYMCGPNIAKSRSPSSLTFSFLAVLFVENKSMKVSEVVQILNGDEFLLAVDDLEIIPLANLTRAQSRLLHSFISSLRLRPQFRCGNEAEVEQRTLQINSQFRGRFSAYYRMNWLLAKKRVAARNG